MKGKVFYVNEMPIPLVIQSSLRGKRKNFILITRTTFNTKQEQGMLAAVYEVNHSVQWNFIKYQSIFFSYLFYILLYEKIYVNSKRDKQGWTVDIYVYTYNNNIHRYGDGT